MGELDNVSLTGVGREVGAPIFQASLGFLFSCSSLSHLHVLPAPCSTGLDMVVLPHIYPWKGLKLASLLLSVGERILFEIGDVSYGSTGGRAWVEAKEHAQGHAGNAAAEHHSMVAHFQCCKPPDTPNSGSFPPCITQAGFSPR